MDQNHAGEVSEFKFRSLSLICAVVHLSSIPGRSSKQKHSKFIEGRSHPVSQKVVQKIAKLQGLEPCMTGLSIQVQILLFDLCCFTPFYHIWKVLKTKFIEGTRHWDTVRSKERRKMRRERWIKRDSECRQQILRITQMQENLHLSPGETNVHLHPNFLNFFLNIWQCICTNSLWTSEIEHLNTNCYLKLQIDFYKIAHIDSAAFLPIIISSFFAMHVENRKQIQNCYMDI